ncbi:hypothetical protein HDU98_009853 [Podochytrium sp. JEL0797]|nr:hypothetical protein HDU98_009853 [Podochytrium sp. JEL0797]
MAQIVSAKAAENLKQMLAKRNTNCSGCGVENFASLLNAGVCGKCTLICANCQKPAVKQVAGLWLCAVDLAKVGSETRQTQREPIERNGRVKNKEAGPVILKAKLQETQRYIFSMDVRYAQSDEGNCKTPFKYVPLRDITKQVFGSESDPYLVPANETVKDFAKTLFESFMMSHVREALPASMRAGKLTVARGNPALLFHSSMFELRLTDFD